MNFTIIDFGTRKVTRDEHALSILYFNNFEVSLSSDEVKEIQRALGINPNGFIDPATRDAILQYQDRFGLQETGELETGFTKILLSNMDAIADASNAYELRLTPNYLVEFQAKINLSVEEKSAQLDQQTCDAIRLFQTSINEEPTSFLSEALVTKIYASIPVQSEPSRFPSPPPKP
jgi:hypothetical protein